MHLPSFLWLWKAAAWSMGFTILAYGLLALSGSNMLMRRRDRQARPLWLRPFHLITGVIMVLLVLFLLGIGIVGTLGQFGSLGQSVHFWAGFAVVDLVLLSAWSAVQIGPTNPWARPLHLGTNLVLLLGLVGVSVTGWSVVQKYL
jgi:Protein of unknown function (DUF4079)